MKTEEAKNILVRLRVMFPSFAELMRTMPDKSETIGVWEKSLETQEVADVASILEDWQVGRQTIPPAFERERLVYLLVEAARAIRNNRYSKLESERVRENAVPTPEQIRERREAYRPIASQRDGMGNAMRRILTASPKGKPRWEWTRQEEIDYIDNLNRVAAEYAKELGLPKPDPIPHMHEQRAAAAKRQQAEPQPAEEFFAWQGN